ncbi:MAG: iron-containing alcohol dehydrogenase [Granulosicoccus sp.]|nr:iron-containing alcohol dehydrogenase [Granulosicoccus sp.]
MSDYSGILSALVSGDWVEPDTGLQYDIGINDIVIRDSLDGAEAALIAKQHGGKSITIVSDPYTHEALGQRVFNALSADGQKVSEYIWQNPECSDKGVEHLRSVTAGSDALIAVGSGTINDTVKYACFLDNRDYSVFATSPMNAFTTGTASVSFGGFKQSISCRGARGVYFDLSVLAKCPGRLISAAFADVICRTTAQVDWLMSHILFNTDYSEVPYTLLAYDEPGMVKRAGEMLSGDVDSLGMLTRISAIMGLGTRFTETTHSGSMAEHMISHYIDMFAGERHPRSSHGEQVGVATITMSQLQHGVLDSDSPPLMRPTVIDREALLTRFGPDNVDNMIKETQRKALDQKRADMLNERFASGWGEFRSRLQKVMLPFETLDQSMQAAGCQRTASDLGLDTDFYREAVSGARYIRDRFSMLDIVDDSVGLDTFVTTMPV